MLCPNCSDKNYTARSTCAHCGWKPQTRLEREIDAKRETAQQNARTKRRKEQDRLTLIACLIFAGIFLIGLWILPSRRYQEGWFELTINDVISAVILAVVAYIIMITRGGKE